MNYPDKETYAQLYERYVNGVGRSIRELVDLVPVTGKRVLDLCGGAGDIAMECQARGADVTLVDRESAMADIDALKAVEVSVYEGSVEDFLAIPKLRKFDVAFCRQAVNYWFDEDSANHLADSMNVGGHFVFNTFNTPPSVEPQVQRYVMIDGERVWYDDWSRRVPAHVFVEVAQLVGDMVHHVQCRDGIPMHFTQFRWIPRDEFRRLLEPRFSFEVKMDGHTDIYICQRR